MNFIIAQKTTIPNFGITVFNRVDPVEKLDAGVLRKVTVVHAPAGYGKTALVAGWACSCSKKIHWVTVDEEDNNQGAVKRILSAWLESQNLFCQESASAALMDYFLDFFTTLSTDNQEHVCIWDDFHHIQAGEILTAIQKAILYLPKNIHFIFISRTELKINLEKIRMQNDAIEIDHNDLRLSYADFAAYIQARIGNQTTLVRTLFHKTQGWFTGIRLFEEAWNKMKVSGGDDLGKWVANFKGSSTEAKRYFQEEIFSSCSTEVKKALLVCSVIGEFNPQSILSIWPDASEDALSIVFGRGDFFLTPALEWNGYFTFHPLFLDFLKGEYFQYYRSLQLPEEQTLHKRVGEWFEKHGSLENSINHFLSGDEVERAINCVNKIEIFYYLIQKPELVIEWMNAIEHLGKQPPWLDTRRTWAYMILNDLENANKSFETALTRLGMSMEDPQTWLGEASRAEKIARVEALTVFIYLRMDKSNSTLIHYEQVYSQQPEYFSENSALFSVFLFTLAYVSNGCGQIEKMESYIQQAIKVSHSSGFDNLSSVFLIFSAIACERSGKIKMAYELYVQLIQSESVSKVYDLGELYYLIGMILWEWNRIEEAGQQLMIGFENSRNQQKSKYLVLSANILIQQVLGNKRKAKEDVRILEGYVQTTPWNDLMSILLSSLVNYWSLEGDGKSMTRWESVIQSGMDSSKWIYRYQLTITYSRLLLVKGITTRTVKSFAEARGLLVGLIEVLDEKNLRLLLEARLLLAYVLRAQRNIDKAWDEFVWVFERASVEGFQRLFLTDGLLVKPFLDQAVEMDFHQDYAKMLLQNLEKENPSAARTLGLVLSNREEDVLRLLSVGLSNQEISYELDISLSTVKTHISNIYKKFDVRSRLQAVRKAYQLHIL